MENFLNTGLGRELLAHMHQIADNIKPLVKELKRANDLKEAEKAEEKK